MLYDEFFLELQNLAGHLLVFPFPDLQLNVASVVNVRHCVFLLTHFPVCGDHSSLMVLVDGVDPPAQEVALFLRSDCFGQVEDLVHFLPVFLTEVDINKLFSGVFGLVFRG